MTQDYKGLMMQVNDKPYLQTVDANLATGVREPYSDGAGSIIPYIRMAYSNTGGSIDAGGYVLGVFLIKAHYTVRGRRALPLSAVIRIRMMSDEERTLFK
jgi:hypothetical protein